MNPIDKILEILGIADELAIYSRNKRRLNQNLQEIEDLQYLEAVMERVRLQVQQYYSILNK